MRIAPWKLMVGLSVVLVIVGVVVSLTGFSPLDIVVATFFGGSIIVAMYVGWRIGKAVGGDTASSGND